MQIYPPVPTMYLKIFKDAKTKVIAEDPFCNQQVFYRLKDVVTAKNGRRISTLNKKDVFATETSCNVFRYLNLHAIPTHYLGQIDQNTFLAQKTTVISLLVKIRRIPSGSYLKRHADVAEIINGRIFKDLVIDFQLKDDALCDPTILVADKEKCFRLYISEQSLGHGYLKDIKIIPGLSEDFDETKTDLKIIANIAEKAFLILESAFKRFDADLVDLCLQFGYSPKKTLVISDVICGDTWSIRLLGDIKKGKDRNIYRECDEVTPEIYINLFDNYRWGAEITAKFI